MTHPGTQSLPTPIHRRRGSAAGPGTSRRGWYLRGGRQAGSGCDDLGVEVAAGHVGELVQAAVEAHRRMLESASRLTDADCRGPSLLPGWSRGHVLAHWARNADGQSRMLAAAMRGVVTAQYPGGDAQRAAEVEAGAARPARVMPPSAPEISSVLPRVTTLRPCDT
jgi:hypothetical protein